MSAFIEVILKCSICSTVAKGYGRLRRRREYGDTEPRKQGHRLALVVDLVKIPDGWIFIFDDAACEACSKGVL